MEVDNKILYDILIELKEIKTEIKNLKKKDINPEYIDKLKNIDSQKGKVFETEEQFNKYMDEL